MSQHIFDGPLAEPFPDKGEVPFFPAPGQLEMLQQIEESIRQRRGLHIVLGEEGLGKSTLCRHLSAILGRDGGFLPVIIDNPRFRTGAEFLKMLLGSLPGTPDDSPWSGARDEEQLRVELSAALDRLAADGKLALFLIDRAELFSGHGLRRIHALLAQSEPPPAEFVLLGSPKFGRKLAAMPALRSRAAEIATLLPFDLQTTRDFVRHRLESSRLEGWRLAPMAFSDAALKAVHAASGGNPERIVEICRELMQRAHDKKLSRVGMREALALLGLRSRAGVLLLAGAVLALALLALAGVAVWRAAPTLFNAPPPSPAEVVGEAPAPEPKGIAKPQAEHGKPAPAPQSAPSSSETANAPAPAETKPAPPSAGAQQPESPPAPAPAEGKLGELEVGQGEIVSSMINRVYGRFSMEILEQLKRANPGVPDLDRLAMGQKLTFPEIAAESGAIPENAWWISLGSQGSLSAAYVKLRELTGSGDAVILAVREGGKRVFLVAAPRFFESEAAAKAWLAARPQAYRDAAALRRGPGKWSAYLSTPAHWAR